MIAPTTAEKLTAEEFFAFVHLPENAGRWFELDRGKVVEMPPPGERHGLVCSNVNFLLSQYVRQTRRGYVLSNDTGMLLDREPDTVRGPDVAYFDASRPDAEMNPKFVEQTAALVVEVWSPNDRPGKMTRRIAGYLRSGVKMVWLIDPEGRDVTVYRPGQDDEVYDENQELNGGDSLPGFRCRVADLFFSTGDQPI
jgi:Uma2 family endonuclease